MSVPEIGFAVVGLGMGANRARTVVATPGAKLVAVGDQASMEQSEGLLQLTTRKLLKPISPEQFLTFLEQN